MSYRRTKTRPPRPVEVSAATQELAELRVSFMLLRSKLQATQEELRLKDLEAEKLLLDKVALGTELMRARAALDFLKGRL